MANPEQVLQQLRDQVQMLTTELAAQRLELDAAKGALDDQQTQTATTALAVAQTPIAQLGQTDPQKKILNPKLVKPPRPVPRYRCRLGTLQICLCDVDQHGGFNISRSIEEGRGGEK